MRGLLTPPDDLYGGITEHLIDNKIYAVTMMQHDPPVIYVQKCQCLLMIRDNSFLDVCKITDVTYTAEYRSVAQIDLSEDNSLEKLVAELCKMM